MAFLDDIWRLNSLLKGLQPLISVSKKICLLGDFAVGKSSLMRRFVYDRFDDKYLSTIGVKVSRKTIMTPKGSDVAELNMMIWDLAGSEEFTPIRASYFGGAAGAVLVCDLTRTETLDHLEAYVNDFYRVRPNTKIVIAANKVDLSDQLLLDSQAVADVAGRLNAPYFMTSAKVGDDVDTMFRHLGQLII